MTDEPDYGDCIIYEGKTKHPLGSNSLTELATDLVKAQASIGAAKRDGNNPLFNSCFATLDAVIDAIREPLTSNGLCFLQLPVYHPAGIGLRTMLLHTSGQFIESEMALPLDVQMKDGNRKGRTDVQAAGSTITYMRRYALLSLLGIPTEDDDGNTAGERAGSSTAKSTRSSKGSSNGKVTEPQCKMFYALTKKLGLDDEAIARGFEDRGFEGAEFKDLTKKQGSEVLDSLKQREEAEKANAKD